MEYYFGVAKEHNIRDEEIGAAQSIVMAVSAGRVRAQFREARTRKKKLEQQGGDPVDELRDLASRKKLFLLGNPIRVAGADVVVELGELAEILPADGAGGLWELKGQLLWGWCFGHGWTPSARRGHRRAHMFIY